jgi:hypothetical protein
MNTALEVVFVLAVILGLIAIAAGVLWFAREEGWELPEPLRALADRLFRR